MRPHTHAKARICGSRSHDQFLFLEQMATVAERFGMSVQRLIDLNADLASLPDENFIEDGVERVSSSASRSMSLLILSRKEKE